MSIGIDAVCIDALVGNYPTKELLSWTKNGSFFNLVEKAKTLKFFALRAEKKNLKKH